MTVEELFYFLESEMENGNIDLETEVRFAAQPNYPFEYSIESVVNVDGTVYLSEDRQEGYLSHEVADELGWK